MDTESPCSKAKDVEEGIINEGQKEYIMCQIDEIGSIAGRLWDAPLGVCQDSISQTEDCHDTYNPETEHQWREDICMICQNHSEAECC